MRFIVNGPYQHTADSARGRIGRHPALQNARPIRNAPSPAATAGSGAIVICRPTCNEIGVGITSTTFVVLRGPVKIPSTRPGFPAARRAARQRQLLRASSPAARLRHRRLDPRAGGADGHRRLRPSSGNGCADALRRCQSVVPIIHTRATVGPMGRTVATSALLDSVITFTQIGRQPSRCAQAPRASPLRSGRSRSRTGRS